MQTLPNHLVLACVLSSLSVAAAFVYGLQRLRSRTARRKTKRPSDRLRRLSLQHETQRLIQWSRISGVVLMSVSTSLCLGGTYILLTQPPDMIENAKLLLLAALITALIGIRQLTESPISFLLWKTLLDERKKRRQRLLESGGTDAERLHQIDMDMLRSVDSLKRDWWKWLLNLIRCIVTKL